MKLLGAPGEVASAEARFHGKAGDALSKHVLQDAPIHRPDHIRRDPEVLALAERPVEDIPVDVPVYNVKYVYVYHVTPEVVYVGYTPAYTGCYVYGTTIVYGTGYYYPGWYGRYYWARPATWGFSV